MHVDWFVDEHLDGCIDWEAHVYARMWTCGRERNVLACRRRRRRRLCRFLAAVRAVSCIGASVSHALILFASFT